MNDLVYRFKISLVSALSTFSPTHQPTIKLFPVTFSRLRSLCMPGSLSLNSFSLWLFLRWLLFVVSEQQGEIPLQRRQECLFGICEAHHIFDSLCAYGDNNIAF